MREIKFRAWDNVNSRFYYTDKDIDAIYFSRDGQPLSISTEKATYFVRGGEEPQCVLQQFTGLKDKNSKEIYEGDILKESDNEIVFAVEYDSERGMYKMPDEYDPEYIFAIGTIPTDVEVIGNIYENPELLAE